MSLLSVPNYFRIARKKGGACSNISIRCHHEANRGVKIFYYKGRREVRRNPNRFTISYPVRKFSYATAVLLIAFRFFWKAGSSSTKQEQEQQQQQQQQQ